MAIRVGEGAGISGLPAGMPPVPRGIVIGLEANNPRFPNVDAVRERAVFGPLFVVSRDVFNVGAVHPDKVVTFLPGTNSYSSAYCFNRETGEMLYTDDLRQFGTTPLISIKDIDHRKIKFGEGVLQLGPKNAQQRRTKVALFKALDYEALVRRERIVPIIMGSLLQKEDGPKHAIVPRVRFDAAYSMDWSTQSGADTAILVRSTSDRLYYYRHPDKHMGIYSFSDSMLYSGIVARDRFLFGEIGEVDRALGSLEPENDHQYETLVGFMDHIKSEPRSLFR